MAKRSFPGQLPSYPVFPWGILKANKESEKDLDDAALLDLLEGTDGKYFEDELADQIEAGEVKSVIPDRLRIGRCCYTCQYRIKKAGRSFIICKHQNNKHKLWSRLSCQGWKLTRDINRLKEYEKFTQIYVRHSNLLRNWYYHKWTFESAIQDDCIIRLGRVCFLCKRRGEKKNQKVYCNLKKQYVWQYAVCPKIYKLHPSRLEDQKRLSYLRRFIEASGLPTDDFQWAMYHHILNPKYEGD
jgi:hypothetical protein